MSISSWVKRSGGAVDKRSIGIELANEGGLIQREGKLYCFNTVSERTLFKDKYYDCGMLWRGYRFFDAYSENQISSVIALVNYLCGRFGIPRQTPANHFDANNSYQKFKGVVEHHHLRQDKSDVHPGFNWQRLINECGLTLS